MWRSTFMVMLCVAIAYTVAIVVYRTIRRRGASSVIAVSLACAAIPACLFIIPKESVIARALTALVLADLIFRVIDVTRQSKRSEIAPITFNDYCHFLVPFPILLVVYGKKGRQLEDNQQRAVNFIRLSFSAVGVIAGCTLLHIANQSPLIQSSFVFDHLTKLAIFIVVAETASQAILGMERLMGFRTRPLIDRVFRSITPADF